MFSRREFITQGLLPVFAGSAVPAIFANGVAAAAADSPKATPSDRVLVLDQLGESPNHALEGVSAGSLVPPELRSKTPVTALQSLRTFRLQPVNEHGTQVDVENPLMKFYGAFKSAGPAPFGALLDTTLQDALHASHALQATDATYAAKGSYPSTSPIASALKLVAETIVCGLGVRVAQLTLGGFDNHAREKPVHDRLLLDLDQALSAFMQDLQGHGLADKVLVMTWSEFGRRVKENGSAGTDHGTAAPMFLLGTPVQGGLYGEQTSLANLDNGNLKFSTDFP